MQAKTNMRPEAIPRISRRLYQNIQVNQGLYFVPSCVRESLSMAYAFRSPPLLRLFLPRGVVQG